MKRPRTGSRHPADSGGLWLYGMHPVTAPVANPLRTSRRCVLTERAAQTIGATLLRRVEVTTADTAQVSRLLPQGAVHQGAALCCEPLPRRRLDDIVGGSGRKIVVVPDRLVDPRKVGHICR